MRRIARLTAGTGSSDRSNRAGWWSGVDAVDFSH